MVVGQIADGKVSDITRALREENLAVDEDVLQELTRKQYAWQYSFHTKKSIEILKDPRVRFI